MHLPFAFPWVNPGEPRRDGTVSFFPRGGGELSSFGND